MSDDTGGGPPAHWFERADESADERFYAEPRMVLHIDQSTVDALTAYYRDFLPEDADVLDLMSSWVSHLPEGHALGRVAGLGMNAEELAANPQLTERCVQNLNEHPVLPYEDNGFDRAMIVVSIQYLTRPVEVMSELRRVLRPGGRACVAMSHRLFPTKAIAAFQRLPVQQRVQLVGYYLEAGGFKEIEFTDASPARGDPLWLMTATA